METTATDFVHWGLDADWPSQRWLEPVSGRRDDLKRSVRLCHSSATAMVLTCTYPRLWFDDQVDPAAFDPVREIAFETTFTQVNLVLHQISTPGARPEGLIGSLVRYASQQADQYRAWPSVHWDVEAARMTR